MKWNTHYIATLWILVRVQRSKIRDQIAPKEQFKLTKI